MIRKTRNSMQQIIKKVHKRCKRLLFKHNAKVPIITKHAFDRALERRKMNKEMFRTICEQAYLYGKWIEELPKWVQDELKQYNRKKRSVFFFPKVYWQDVFLCKYHYLTGLTCVNTVFHAKQWYRWYLK